MWRTSAIEEKTVHGRRQKKICAVTLSIFSGAGTLGRPHLDAGAERRGNRTTGLWREDRLVYDGLVPELEQAVPRSRQRFREVRVLDRLT